MKWKRSKRGANRDVIDARGSSPSAEGGGGLPIPGNIAGLGGGAGLVVVLVIVAIQIFGGGGGEGGFDIGSVLSGAQAPGTANPVGIPPEEDPQRDLKDFSAYVFNDVQDTWAAVFRRTGSATSRRSSTCMRTRCARMAAGRRPPPSGRSTAQPTSASTSI